MNATLAEVDRLVRDARERLLECIARRVDADEATTEDLLHDAVVLVRGRVAGGRAIASAGLFGYIVTTASRAGWRQGKRRGREVDGGAAEPTASAWFADEHQATLRETLRRCLDKLVVDRRALIAEMYWDDISLTNVATRRGLSKATVCNEHLDALERLRRCIESATTWWERRERR